MKIPGIKSLLIAVLLVVCCTTCTGCLRSVKMAPAFRAQALDGGVVEFNPQALQKPVVLVFWASWCGPCRAEMPALQRLHETLHADGLVVLGVNSTAQDVEADARGFVTDVGVTFPILLDRADDVSQTYRLRALPSTFIVDRHGAIASVMIGGPLSEAVLRSKVESLLAEAP